MSFGNSGYKPPWRPPLWQTREDLERILDQYRRWYAEGLSDVEISARIRQKYPVPNSPPFRRKK